jgi:Protein of unknown function (DUF4230)
VGGKSPFSPKTRATSYTGRGLAGLAVVTAVIVGMLMVGGLLAIKLFKPFETKTIDRTPPPVLVALEDFALYKAATGNYEVLVDNEKDVKYLPSWISGERVFFVGVGEVDAVVDFRNLGQGSVTTSEDRKSVTIVLPHATLEKAKLSIGKSHVAARSRGLADRVGSVFQDSPTDDTPLYTAAEAKMNDAAAASDLVQRAEANTTTMLTRLFNSLGYTSVTIRYDGVSSTAPISSTNVAPAPASA